MALVASDVTIEVDVRNSGQRKEHKTRATFPKRAWLWVSYIYFALKG